MYIAYVYIEEFEGLKDVELCLSNRWVIKRDPLVLDKLGLSIEPNPEFIEGFWQPESKFPQKLSKEHHSPKYASRISNVSALVGKNAIGKTRIMKLLWKIATRQDFEPGFHRTNSKFMCLLHDEKGKWKYTSLFDKPIVFDGFPKQPIEYSLNPIPTQTEVAEKFFKNQKSKVGVVDEESRGNFTLPIYFSPSIQGIDAFGFEYLPGGINVSRSRTLFDWMQGATLSGDLRQGFADKEFKDVLDFIHLVDEFLPEGIGIPKEVTCTFYPFGGKFEHSKIVDEAEASVQESIVAVWNHFLSSSEPILDDLREEFRKERAIKNLDLRRKMVEIAKYGLLMHVVERVGSDKMWKLVNKASIWKEILAKITDGVTIELAYTIVVEYLEKFTWASKGSVVRWKIIVEDFVSILETNEVRFIPGPTMDPYLRFHLNFSGAFKLHELLLKLNGFYREISKGDDIYRVARTNYFPELPWFFSFWPAMSTGKQAFLTQIALIATQLREAFPASNASYYYKYYRDFNYSEMHPILLLVDEGDSFLHPELQRSYIHDFLQLIVLSGQINLDIQIVFSTHSPIILSDFPSSSVILLRDKDSPTKEIQTFGANLHTLLKDDFFLEDTIGKFARNKIDQLVLEIPEAKTEEKHKSISARIGMIGEPMLRERLRTYHEFSKMHVLLSQKADENRKKNQQADGEEVSGAEN